MVWSGITSPLHPRDYLDDNSATTLLILQTTLWKGGIRQRLSQMQTTGLVGLAVCETPHERLKILYTKILDVLGQIPKNAAYRKYTEQITNEKLGMVKAEPDVKKLEEQLQGGQIEEVILQAENELSLARKMLRWKPWEPLVEEPPANQWKWPI